MFTLDLFLASVLLVHHVLGTFGSDPKHRDQEKKIQNKEKKIQQIIR